MLPTGNSLRRPVGVIRFPTSGWGTSRLEAGAARCRRDHLGGTGRRSAAAPHRAPERGCASGERGSTRQPPGGRSSAGGPPATGGTL
eukprot:7471628-Alexandrium_andersonii.AAC.1